MMGECDYLSMPWVAAFCAPHDLANYMNGFLLFQENVDKCSKGVGATGNDGSNWKFELK